MITELDSKKNNRLPGTKRIESLADGIFAIAMTLLVLNLSLPPVEQHTPSVLLKMLSGQIYDFLDYALSFILLAIFWVIHHQQFHYIQRTDTRLIWINIFILMFVALVPFSTSIVGDFGINKVADVFFSANMLVLGFLFLIGWAYATGERRLVSRDLDTKIIAQGIRRMAFIPIVALITMVTALFNPYWSLWIFLLIPTLLLFKPFRSF